MTVMMAGFLLIGEVVESNQFLYIDAIKTEEQIITITLCPPASPLHQQTMKPNAAIVAHTGIERKFRVKDKTRLRKRRSERWSSVAGGPVMAAWDKKEKLEMKAWLTDVAPSPKRRKWFAHDPAKWQEF